MAKYQLDERNVERDGGGKRENASGIRTLVPCWFYRRVAHPAESASFVRSCPHSKSGAGLMEWASTKAMAGRDCNALLNVKQLERNAGTFFSPPLVVERYARSSNGQKRRLMMTLDILLV